MGHLPFPFSRRGAMGAKLWTHCHCLGHVVPYVRHVGPCCDRPHITKVEFEARNGGRDGGNYE